MSRKVRLFKRSLPPLHAGFVIGQNSSGPYLKLKIRGHHLLFPEKRSLRGLEETKPLWRVCPGVSRRRWCCFLPFQRQGNTLR